ncbi:MAG: ABC transporter ATP-binding protein [Proteobacteria bacterium]|nr:ABC transporter ATP-binding protein [Pseudomonadota bacterium]
MTRPGSAAWSSGEALPIQVRQVTKTYGRVVALDHVDLDVRSGEFLTLLGPSGSGKTTLLMVLAGFVRPDRGSVRFGEQEVIRLAPHRRGVGMVFQSYALFPHLSVAENIAFPLKLRGVARSEAMRRAEEALALVQLPGLGGRSVAALSGGQRQRVALARAIVFEPRILLMDEPLSALDKQLREHMQIELRRLHDRLGITTVCVTHDQREALTMSDRIAVIDHGRIVQLDEPRRVYDHPATRFVAEFVGESAFLPVRRSGEAYYLGETPLRLDGQAVPEGADLLMVRPERLRLLAEGEAADGTVIAGAVREIVYQGDSVLVQVALAGGQAVAARIGSAHGAMRALPAVGDAVRLALAPQDACLLRDDAA